MAYIGRYQLGDNLPLLLQTHDASNVAQTPNDVPTVKIFNASGTLVYVAKMPSIEKFTQTGRFLLLAFLSGIFSAGLYQAVYYYTVSSYHGLEFDTFEVLPGGDATGDVMSMYFFDRPQAKYIVYETHGGQLIQGRNPIIP